MDYFIVGNCIRFLFKICRGSLLVKKYRRKKRGTNYQFFTVSVECRSSFDYSVFTKFEEKLRRCELNENCQ